MGGALLSRARRRKYGNTKCTYNGIKFDSKAELNRFHDLKSLERRGLISGLKVHPKWDLEFSGNPLIIKGEKRKTKATYTADFSYWLADGTQIVEDIKSPITANEYAFKLKRAVWEAMTGMSLEVIIIK